MSFPIQAPPVRRPELVDPATMYPDIDQLNAEQKIAMQRLIGFDANFNDPQWFAVPTVEVMKVSARPGRG